MVIASKGELVVRTILSQLVVMVIVFYFTVCVDFTIIRQFSKNNYIFLLRKIKR